MLTWTYIEPCCGSAALAWSLLGATRSLLPYQGSKWRFRGALTELVRAAGMHGVPERVVLTDPGPFGVVVPTLLEPSARQRVIDGLEALAVRDPREVYAALHGGLVPEDPVDFTVQLLFLQRLAFSGKAVGVREGRWMSPGFNTSSAYGVAGTDRFGQVQPMVPGLIRVLQTYRKVARPARLEGGQRRAEGPGGPVTGPTLVYLDPPYVRSTLYPGGHLDRGEVVALATAWAAAGAHVLVSEGEPVAELVSQGWEAVRIDPGRQDGSPFRGKQAEWVTRWPRPAGEGGAAPG